MFTKAQEANIPKYVLLTALIALAVLISLAAAGKVSAAESDIESIKYEPAKQEIVCDTEIPSDSPYYYIEDKQQSYENPYCAFTLVEGLSLDDLTLDGFKDPKLFENHFIASGDKLTVTRKDGSVQTLMPYYKSFRVLGGPYGDQEMWEDAVVWVDKNTNKATDIVTEFTWNNTPEMYNDSYLFKEKYKKGTYDNTVTVKVGDKSTQFIIGDKSATFKKKIVVKGSVVSSYDKKVPVISNKKVTSGYKKLHKNAIIEGFWIKWPKIKGADSYTVKLKYIHPVSVISSNYVMENDKFNTNSNILKESTPTNLEYLTEDTMVEISVSTIKKSNPTKTGSEYVYGKYSKPVRIFLSKNKTLKAAGKKKSVKLTWDKVYRASGYTIKYSTKKNMAKAKTIKVKGANKKAYTIKKLKKNKKYYFQITPYKVYKGKTYTGYTSAKKAAKAR